MGRVEGEVFRTFYLNLRINLAILNWRVDRLSWAELRNNLPG